MHLTMTHLPVMETPGPSLATGGDKVAGPTFAGKRLTREWRTIVAMVGCYCRDHHAAGAALCPECLGLLGYAAGRLERCRFGLEKPVCARCPVHCYQHTRREQVKAVMRYAGPRMLWRHPILSLLHWLDGFRRAPAVASGG
jgi:hypothetical protein